MCPRLPVPRCELFVRDVTRSFNESAGNFEECKALLVERGERFADLCGRSRSTIAELGRPFIRDGATVGSSRTTSFVLHVL